MEMARRQRKKKRQLPHQNQRPRNLCHWRTVQHWVNPATDEEILTCTIGTTEANPLMAEIHNTKHRMPILLNQEIQYLWLDDIPVEDFLYPNYNPILTAENLTNLEANEKSILISTFKFLRS